MLVQSGRRLLQQTSAEARIRWWNLELGRSSVRLKTAAALVGWKSKVDFAAACCCVVIARMGLVVVIEGVVVDMIVVEGAAVEGRATENARPFQ